METFRVRLSGALDSWIKERDIYCIGIIGDLRWARDQVLQNELGFATEGELIDHYFADPCAEFLKANT